MNLPMLLFCRRLLLPSGPGQLQLKLGVASMNDIQLYRPPQEDMTITIAGDHVAKDIPENINNLLQLIGTSDSVRSLGFESLQGTSSKF